jgi:hypothetical protein
VSGEVSDGTEMKHKKVVTHFASYIIPEAEENFVSVPVTGVPTK